MFWASYPIIFVFVSLHSAPPTRPSKWHRECGAGPIICRLVYGSKLHKKRLERQWPTTTRSKKCEEGDDMHTHWTYECMHMCAYESNWIGYAGSIKHLSEYTFAKWIHTDNRIPSRTYRESRKQNQIVRHGTEPNRARYRYRAVGWRAVEPNQNPNSNPKTIRTK